MKNYIKFGMIKLFSNFQILNLLEVFSQGFVQMNPLFENICMQRYIRI